MPDQKISQLTAIVTVDNSTDVLPIVDTSANTTKKVTPTQLKTSLALDNVDNTSDANKPVSIAQQDALNAKVTANAAITAGTAPKVTFDAKGLVTSGDSLDETDLPTGINANKIGTGVVSTTEFEYLNGVTSAIQTQIDSKQATLVSGTNIKTVNSTSLVGSGDVAVQPTLVSGTNIKTINSTSLLGSGDITVSANPSGVAGAIQFSNGSAFASDATNLFWDDTNNRLGVGTNTPSYALDVSQNVNGNLFARLENTNAGGFGLLLKAGSGIGTYTMQWSNYLGSGGGRIYPDGIYIGQQSSPTARLQVQGSGSTSATTSLLVQNSAGTELLKVADNGEITTYDINARVIYARANTLELRPNASGGAGSASLQGFVSGLGWLSMFTAESGKDFGQIPRGAVVNGTTIDASAIFQIDSTTKGFLPPRMTTTQKNAIATPAAGLVVYDSTTNKLCCYDGSTWNDLF